MIKQKISTLLISMGVVVVAFIVGLFFEKATKIIDSPAEQMAEIVLANHGINIDFSKSKKNILEGK